MLLTRPRGTTSDFGTTTGSVPVLLRLTVLTALVLPANMVLEPLGASGYVAMIVALVLFGVWAASALWNGHDAIGCRHPARIGLTLFWLTTILSYLRMTGADTTARASADRWLLGLLAVTAIVCVTAETVTSTDRALVLVRTVIVGATVTSAVALWQFVFRVDPLDVVRSVMVGTVDNGGQTTFQQRGTLTRVAGNTFTPIELGVVTSMVLPLAVWRALVDRSAGRVARWLPCVLVTVACVLTVSRSAVLGLVVATAITVPFLPRHARRWAAIVVPTCVVGVFVAVPGLIATLASSIGADPSTDPSLATRVNNYPRVQAMIADSPWFGIGPATYLPDNALDLLDNQYLHSAVETGLPGALALVAVLVLPIVAAGTVACWARDPELRLLAAAVAAGCAVAAVSSAVFDSLSFPVFRIVWPVLVGLSGSVWLIARRTAPTRCGPPDRGPVRPAHTTPTEE